MANNNFSTKDFFSGAYFAPIALGEHTVTIGKAKAIVETKEDGSDGSYLLLPMTFENNRKVDNRFYGIGAKIACDQIRQQLEDATDYKSLQAFLKTLEGKELKVWISRREYIKDDAKRTTLQYDFTEPTVEADDADETDPF